MFSHNIFPNNKNDYKNVCITNLRAIINKYLSPSPQLYYYNFILLNFLFFKLIKIFCKILNKAIFLYEFSKTLTLNNIICPKIKINIPA